MNNQPRILIIYTSTYSNPYLRINELGIKKTWANFSNLYPQVAIKSIIGIENKNTLLFRFYAFLFELIRNRRFETYFNFIIGKLLIFVPFKIPICLEYENELKVNARESLFTLGIKFFRAIEYCCLKNFDILIITNSSSYINVPYLLTKVSDLPLNIPLYGGRSISNGSKYGASGSFVMLNNSACNLIMSKKSNWNFSKIDDVALLSVCKSLGIPFTKYESLDLKSIIEIQNLKEKDLQNIHFKIGPAFNFSTHERNDEMNLLALHEQVMRFKLL